MQTKAACREVALANLSKFNDEQRAWLAQALTKQVTNEPAWQKAQMVALSLAQPVEIPTQLLIQTALLQKKQVLLPRVASQHQLDFVPVNEETSYQQHKFGMWEPVGEPVANLSLIDLVIVPGLAFAKNGARLGFGGGYYDRWLPKLSATTIGVTVPDNYYEYPIWPVEKTDQSVDQVLVLERKSNDE